MNQPKQELSNQECQKPIENYEEDYFEEEPYLEDPIEEHHTENESNFHENATTTNLT